jgi:Zn-dependent protease
MFAEPQQTQFDLNWRMFGVPIRVHPLFWLVSAILGWNLTRIDFRLLLLWIACVFVSILLHEFGHVLMGQVFGARGHIVLYGMGGLAVGSSDLRNRWQRVAVYFAGPGIGFLFVGLIWLALKALNPEMLTTWVDDAIDFLFWINLAWGLVNLLPVFPLDGGRVSREVCEWMTPANGRRVAYGISMVIAGLLALNALSMEVMRRTLLGTDVSWIPPVLGGYWIALLFGWMAYDSYLLLQHESYRRPWDKEEEF